MSGKVLPKRARQTALTFIMMTCFAVGWPGPSIAFNTQSDEPLAIVEIPTEAKTLTSPLLQGLSSEKELIGTKRPKLDSSLKSMADVVRDNLRESLTGEAASGTHVPGDAIQVYVDVDSEGLENALEAIKQVGGKATRTSKDASLIQAWVPLQKLEALVDNNTIHFIRQPDVARAEENLIPESATSEALSAMNATTWHAAGYTGAGVKIGIIDLGFTGYKSLLGTELPGSVTVKNFVDSETDSLVDGSTEHGTACVEIIHDVAPDARLFLAKISTSLDFEEAVDWLKDTCQVDIISSSISFTYTSPGDGTGFLADKVRQARDAGILWATAAGNYRTQHWAGQYYDSDTDDVHNFSDGSEINCFGPNTDYCYVIGSNQRLTVLLRWDDWTNVNQDYDLGLVRWNGSAWDFVGTGTDPQDGTPGVRPIEIATGTTTGDPTMYGFVIVRYKATRNVNFDALVWNGPPPHIAYYPGSLPGLADAPDAITVAADTVNYPYAQEDFSSEGPTKGPGGTPTGGIIKPDIAGYDRVSTVSYGLQGFAGTSAATPHVAAAAALVLSKYPNYSPNDLQRFLQNIAVDQGTAGKDTKYGYGRLYLGSPGLFADVPQSSWAYNYTTELYNNGITTGCRELPLMFCPGEVVNRAQMAAFIIRAKEGENFSFSSTPYFSDIPSSHWAFKYVQKLKELGITTGCAPNLYCANDTVTREQMATLLIRAKEGESFTYSQIPYFSDVATEDWAFKYIQKLKELGITTGCTSYAYCPADAVTREQMAAFLGRAFLAIP